MKIYVGNLPYKSTEDDILAVFEEFGSVDSVAVIRDRTTGRSKGFAFVEMSSDNEADEAMQSLNGSELGGRKLKVNEARPPEKRLGRGNKQVSGTGEDRRRHLHKDSEDHQRS